MYSRDFVVIQCPKCGKWTYAKARQKTRFCSRCEKQFKIDPLKVIYTDSHAKARMLVKIKNEQEMK